MSKFGACYKCTKRWVKEVDGKIQTCHTSCKEYNDEVAENKRKREAEMRDSVHDRYASVIHNKCLDIANARRKRGKKK